MLHRSLVLAAVLALTSCRHQEAAPPGDRLETIFPGAMHVTRAQLAAIDAARAEAARMQVDVSACAVLVWTGGGLSHVSFSSDSPRAGEFAGCAPGPCPCFEVTLEEPALQVKSSGRSQ